MARPRPARPAGAMRRAAPLAAPFAALFAAAALLAAAPASAGGGSSAGAADAPAMPPATLNDYPTEARADYVFGCMAANGQTREMLSRCSCSIDVIASILPYDEYVAAETVLSMRRTAGERMTIFRTAERAKSVVAELRRAQAEAEIRCF